MSEQALATTRELIDGAFERSPMGILVVDARGNIIVVNQELERLLGYERAELIGQTVERLIPEQFALKHRAVRLDYLHHAQVRPMGAGRELFARHRDGHQIPVEVGLSPITIGSENFVLSTIVDVTERRQLEVKLLQAQKLEAIGNFASGIAHDLNNILLGILGYAELTNTEAGISPDTRANMEVIIESTLRGRDLVERILSFGRKGELQRSAIQWEPVLRETVKLMRMALPPNVGIDIQVDQAVPAVWADPIELQRIFMNLLTNAIHAMVHASGVIRAQVSAASLDRDFMAAHSELQSNQQVCLRVVDEGAGMPPDVVTQIFEPFFTTKAPSEGTGLGLSVVQRIVKILGGIIVVDSREGQGTRVDVYLPVSRGDDARTLQDEKGSHSRQRIVPADDE